VFSDHFQPLVELCFAVGVGFHSGNNFDLLESSPKIFQPITKEEAAVHGDEIAVDKSLNPRETSKQGLLKLLIEQIPLPYYEACRIMQDRMRGSC
jgi:hypothetical protein